MLDTVTNPAAFDLRPEPGEGFRLWYRRTRKHPWELVASAPTASGCWGAMCDDRVRGGQWLVLPTDQQP